jgi:hypothetical protein
MPAQRARMHTSPQRRTYARGGVSDSLQRRIRRMLTYADVCQHSGHVCIHRHRDVPTRVVACLTVCRVGSARRAANPTSPSLTTRSFFFEPVSFSDSSTFSGFRSRCTIDTRLPVSICQHTSAYVSVPVSICQQVGSTFSGVSQIAVNDRHALACDKTTSQYLIQSF